MHYTLNDLSLYSFPLLPSLLSIPLLFPFALSFYSFLSPLSFPFLSLFLYSFPSTLSLYSFPLLFPFTLSLYSFPFPRTTQTLKKIGSKKEVISILKNARFTRSGAKSWPWAFFGLPDLFVYLPKTKNWTPFIRMSSNSSYIFPKKNWTPIHSCVFQFIRMSSKNWTPFHSYVFQSLIP